MTLVQDITQPKAPFRVLDAILRADVSVLFSTAGAQTWPFDLESAGYRFREALRKG